MSPKRDIIRLIIISTATINVDHAANWKKRNKREKTGGNPQPKAEKQKRVQETASKVSLIPSRGNPSLGANTKEIHKSDPLIQTNSEHGLIKRISLYHAAHPPITLASAHYEIRIASLLTKREDPPNPFAAACNT